MIVLYFNNVQKAISTILTGKIVVIGQDKYNDTFFCIYVRE